MDIVTRYVHPVSLSLSQRKRFHMDISRSWPPVSYCSFSHHLTSLVYQGATTSTIGGGASEGEGQNKPKGVFIITNNPIPSHVSIVINTPTHSFIHLSIYSFFLVSFILL